MPREARILRRGSVFLTGAQSFAQTAWWRKNCFSYVLKTGSAAQHAERVFSSWEEIECDSAGLAPDAVVPLSTEQISWADIIFVMEKPHRNKLSKKFKSHLKGKRVIVLGIPDDFEFMEEGLVRLLAAKVPQFLR